MVYDIAIVGLGVAGILMLAHIPVEQLERVLVVEASCIGGDLSSLYSSTVANITKEAILDAFRKIPRWAAATFPLLDKYQDEQCPKLGDVCRQMVCLIRGDIERIHYRTATVSALRESPIGWMLETSVGYLDAKKVILCVGGIPKTMDLPRPLIPLHVALSKELLTNNVVAEDRVVVFGTSHSGTLVMKNLKEVGIQSITGVHRGKQPFLFARDGHSEGIKQESATIADEILANAWGTQTPTLVNYDDFGTVFRKTLAATHIVYAHGFQRRALRCVNKENGDVSLQHNQTDGSFVGYEGRLWGFGLAYPGKYTASNGLSYSDIGFGGFIGAIAVSLPAILQ